MSNSSGKADRRFLIYLAILVIFGLAALISASSPYGYSRFGDIYYFVKRQVFFGLIPGFVFFFVLAKIPYGIWKKLAMISYFICLALLIIVFIPGVGADYNKYAHSWIDIGLFHFQPAELVKLALILILSIMLSDPNRDLADWKKGLLPVLTMAAPALFLVMLQPDIGTLVVLGVIVVGMLYLAQIPKTFLALIMAAGIILVAVLAIIAPYRMNRLNVFLHPELDPEGAGYQVNQAYLAIGSGGLWGLGYGHSRQKHEYLPEVQADSIFAVIAEEMGFLISTIFVFLILLLAWRGLKIAKGAPDNFGYYLAGGIAIWFFSQSIINIGAMVGLLPLTGVPLPFVSQGGTSLAICLAAAGLVISVSRGRSR